MAAVTLPLLLSYVGIATALVTAVIAWRFAPGGESLGLWVLAAALAAVSPIADTLRLVFPQAWTLALGTIAVILSEVVAYAATRQLCGRRHTPRVYAAMCVVGCGSFIWFSLVRPLFLPRAMMLSATLAVVAAAIAWVFLRTREPGLTAVFRITGGLFAMYSLGQVVRLLWLPGSGIPQDTIWAPGAAVLNQLLSLPVLLMLALMLVLVTTRRTSAAAAQEREIAEETRAALLADSWSDPLTGLASRARIRRCSSPRSQSARGEARGPRSSSSPWTATRSRATATGRLTRPWSRWPNGSSRSAGSARRIGTPPGDGAKARSSCCRRPDRDRLQRTGRGPCRPHCSPSTPRRGTPRRPASPSSTPPPGRRSRSSTERCATPSTAPATTARQGSPTATPAHRPGHWPEAQAP